MKRTTTRDADAHFVVWMWASKETCVMVEGVNDNDARECVNAGAGNPKDGGDTVCLVYAVGCMVYGGWCTAEAFVP